MKNEFKIGFISDLHGLHDIWEMTMFQGGHYNEMLSCDAIVFCGDLSSRGGPMETKRFLDWYSEFVPGVQKFFIAGNHDFFLDTSYTSRRSPVRHAVSPERIKIREDEVVELLNNYPDLIYLNDSGFEFQGVKFWGSPVSPYFHDWAFNRREDEIGAHWDLIPEDTDVLIVHTPPFEILDRLAPKFQAIDGRTHVGCPLLRKRIEEVKPKVVGFGHIHEAYGVYPPVSDIEYETVFVNASCLNENYTPINPPQFVTIKL